MFVLTIVSYKLRYINIITHSYKLPYYELQLHHENNRWFATDYDAIP